MAVSAVEFPEEGTIRLITLKVVGSNPTPATTETDIPEMGMSVFSFSAPFPVNSRILPR